MNKDTWKKVVVPLVLVGIFFASLAILNSEISSTIILLLCILIMFAVKYQKREWILVVVGTVLGIILEIGGDMIYKLQYWNTDSFFGIPLWLPLLWGFQFVLVYRIGSLIVNRK